MTATLFTRHETTNFAAWKQLFGDSADFVAQNGVLSTSLHRDVDNPNSLVVVHQFEDADAARAFAGMFDGDAFAEGPVKIGGVVPESLEVWICEDI
jgi:hypothetical protein